jgi:MFS family permease
MKILKHRVVYILTLLAVAFVLRFFLVGFLENNPVWIRLAVSITILIIGASFVLRGTAKIIEETTEVLHERTKLAGGLLQSFGTAFPDMALGIIAAIVSLQLRSTDYLRAINFAIIAAATTFGSNIYNVGHATWCVFRQNLANRTKKHVFMFPFLGGGELKPMTEHPRQPSLAELDTAIDVSTALTLLTATVAVSMVLFGQVKDVPSGIEGSLYQLIRPVGLAILFLGILVLYVFRKTKRLEGQTPEIAREEKFFRHQPNSVIWFSLLSAGLAILFAAVSMVDSIVTFCEVTGTPFVIAGVAAGIIGCLGEMIVIHNFTVHPQGRIGDAVVGVAMDNIVTILGASIVAIMGGIFLGSNALIIIFVIILALNTLLIWQISRLKGFLAAGSARSD